jgi:cellulose synthase/poly-beta-1,6-N-acetylglucosamine synthase-like glycosyltransferase
MLVWNAFEHTKLTLKSLYENTENFDLIIFDNGSRSQVKEYLQKFQTEHSNVKLILSNENLGTWKARHIAAGLVQTELMGTIDNDVVFEPNWLEKMATRFDDPQVGQVGVLKLFVHMNHPYLSGSLPQAWRECEKQTKNLQEQLNLFLQHKTIPEFREDLLAFNKDFSESLQTASVAVVC